YFKGEEVLACAPLGVTPYVPKPLTSGSKAAGRFGKQDFVYIPEEDAYRCPADQRLTWRFTSAEKGMTLHSYWTSKCAECPLKTQCTTGKERGIKRWEHEAVIDAMQDRLDRAPKSMRVRRATVEHPFGTLKAWMGATHFKTRTLEKVRTEMSLQSETCDRHPGCRDPDGGHAGLRPRVKSSCFSAVEIRQSKTASRPTIRRS